MNYALRLPLIIVLFALAVAAPQTRAAKILFVVNSFLDASTTSNGNDQEVRDRLVAQGHTVTLADDDTVAAADTTDQDLILISSSVGSGAPGINPLCKNVLVLGRIPVISYEPGVYDELLLQTANTFGNAGGHTSLVINSTNQTHTLAAGKKGTNDIVDVSAGSTATVSSSALPLTLGADAIVIATTAPDSPDPGHIAVWAYEKGSRLADNVSVVPSRRVAFFYNASTAVGTYNTNATDLFDAAIKWALQAPPNLPVTGILRSPSLQGGAADAQIVIELEDGSTSQPKTNTFNLSLNGTQLIPAISRSGKITTLTAKAPAIFPSGSVNNIRLLFSDTLSQNFTNNFQFTTEIYATLPASMKAAPGTIDTTKAGFKIKLRQMEAARPGGGTAASVITQLDDRYINPATGKAYDDLIDRTQTGFEAGSGFNPDGTFTEAGVINYNQDAGTGADAGEFRSPAAPDKPIPGIPGTSGSTDNIAMRATTYLQLKAGLNRLAVNSDDGFRVAAGRDGRDAFALVLGAFDADRGAATTEFSVMAPEDGLYPIELLFWETGGGAEVEFFSIDRSSGARILINDKSNVNALKAYQPPKTADLPLVLSVKPGIGGVSVSRDTAIEITLADASAVQVATNSIKLSLNGTVVTPSITRSNGLTTIFFDPPGSLAPLSLNTVTLQFSDTATPANSRSEQFSFTVESVLPKALIVVAALPANASELSVSNRLKSKGYEVVMGDDNIVTGADAAGKDLVVISSTVSSGNVQTKFTDFPGGVVDWEWAALDGLGMTEADGTALANQTQIEIVKADHPLAAGFPTGMLTIFSSAADQVASGTPVPSAVVIANAGDGSGAPVLFALEKGADLSSTAAGGITKAPGRRVSIFLGGDTFTRLNADGLKVFDAAVSWAANLAPAGARLSVSKSGNSIALSWTGGGTLEQADNVNGPWTTAGNQTNPQTIQPAGTRKFFRIKS